MKKIIILLLLGLVLRLVLSIQFYSGDVNNHIAWGKDILLNGMQGIYDREFYFRYGVLTPNYPPFALFLFTGAFGLYEIIYNTSWWLNIHVSLFPSNIIFWLQNPNLLPAFLKLPAIFADLGIAYFVYLFAKKLKQNEKWSLIAASFVLFNPAFFYNSASWGQVEALPLVFVLTAFYTLFYSKLPVLSAILFTFGLLTKQTCVIFMPIFLLYFFKNYSIKDFVKASVFSVLSVWMIMQPFNNNQNILTFPFETYFSKILINSVSDYVSYHAFNMWILFVGLNKVHDFNTLLFGISYQLWGLGLFIIFSFIVLYSLWGKMSEYSVLFGSTLVAFASFLFLTRLHERHLAQTLPFLLLFSIKEKKFLPIFIFVSLFQFINMYHDWWAPRLDLLVSILSELSILKFLEAFLLVSFVILFFKFLRSSKPIATNK